MEGELPPPTTVETAMVGAHRLAVGGDLHVAQQAMSRPAPLQRDRNPRGLEDGGRYFPAVAARRRRDPCCRDRDAGNGRRKYVLVGARGAPRREREALPLDVNIEVDLPGQ